MRLIDADKLKATAVLGVQLQHADSRYYYFYEENTIANAPTVEAIPIDWITKWAEKFYKVINGKRYYMGDGYDTIWDLLEDWERENQYGKN